MVAASGSGKTSALRHGLIILAVGFAVVFFSSSIKNTFQVFFVQLTESFGQSRGEFAVAASVFMLVFGIASPIVGSMADRLGPKKTILVGLILSGLAFIGCASFESFYAFVFLYGVVAAFGLTAMSYVPLGLIVDQSFPERYKGLAYGTLTNGVAIGFMLLSPIWVFSQEYVGWRPIFMGLGVLFIAPLLLLVYKLLPGEPASTKTSEDRVPQLSLGERLRLVFFTRPFYALMIGFFGCGVTMAFIDVHMVAHLQDMALSPGQISMALVLLGATELAGGFLAGWMCDRWPKAYVIAGFYFIRAVSLAFVLLMPNAMGAYIFVALFGISYLGTVVGTSMYALGLFGSSHKGFAFGFIWLVHQIGAFGSTQLGANAFDKFGDYSWTIIATGVFALFSSLISLVVLPPNPSATEPVSEPVLSKA